MYLVGGCFVVSTILMQVFHWCKINVFKIVIFMGTFALALAFAGNDLVNFVGVPLAAYSAYQDFAANTVYFPVPFRCGDGLCFGHVEEGT